MDPLSSQRQSLQPSRTPATRASTEAALRRETKRRAIANFMFIFMSILFPYKKREQIGQKLCICVVAIGNECT